MQKQVKIIDAYEKGGIITLNLEKPSGKVGQEIDLEFKEANISAVVIKKIGKQLKLRTIKVYPKSAKTEK